MRIIAGRFKGRRLEGPSDNDVRPTSDRLRETLFNILGASIEGETMLDGFAGTGAVGLEALSRGAARVTFVEHDRGALAVMRRNIAHCGATGASSIVQADFNSWAAGVRPGKSSGGDERGDGSVFDLVWLDPPYNVPDMDAVLAAAARRVARDGRLVLEHSRRRAAPLTVGGFVRERALTAGDSALAFFVRAARPDGER